MKNPFQTALDVQNACNLQAVLTTWADIQKPLDEHRTQQGGHPGCLSTEERRRHPVNILFADKAADLCGISRNYAGNDFAEALAQCEWLATHDRLCIRVTCANGHTWTTQINGTLADVREYFQVGTPIDTGSQDGPEDMSEITKVQMITVQDMERIQEENEKSWPYQVTFVNEPDTDLDLPLAWVALDPQVREDLVEWFNRVTVSESELRRLAALEKDGRFEVWECPSCGDRVYKGSPEDWDHFQGVKQVDYTSFPGSPNRTDNDQLCDNCRCYGVGGAQ